MDMDTLFNIMLNEWKMERPNLLISVTGGAKGFALKPGLKNVFRDGLVKAAESTGILLPPQNSCCLLFGLDSLNI